MRTVPQLTSVSRAPPGRDSWQPRTRGRRGAEEGPRRSVPGRETAVAESSERRGWHGYGTLSRVEKSGFGCLFHDTSRVFGEVAVLGLPALVCVWISPQETFVGATAMALLAWLVMTLVGTLVRGGWIHPPATPTPGWVTLSPWLLILRVFYFNPVLLVASFGGSWVTGLLESSVLGLAFAGGVAALSMLAFPRVVDWWMVRRA